MPEKPTASPQPDEPETEQLPTAGTASIGVIGGRGWVENPAPASTVVDDPDEEWPVRGPKRGLRVPVPAAVLLVLLVGAGGIWGGAVLERGRGSSGSATSSLRTDFASRFGSAGFSDLKGSGTSRSGASGFTGFGASSAAAEGTVTEVTGKTLYVTTSTGSLVKVVLGSGATVSRTATTSLSGLKLGDTVVVEGTKAKSGTVTATSVTATAARSSTATGGSGGTAGGSAGG